MSRVRTPDSLVIWCFVAPWAPPRAPEKDWGEGSAGGMPSARESFEGRCGVWSRASDKLGGRASFDPSYMPCTRHTQ